MTDKAFQKLLNDLTKANARYKSLLRDAEDEIEARFGVCPSDVDNDSWIDVFHVGVGSMTVKQVTESMSMGMDIAAVKRSDRTSR